VYDSFIAALEHLAKGTQGLSGVMGNYHAPFLGEGATATSPPYPAYRSWVACYGVSNRVKYAGEVSFGGQDGVLCVVSRLFASVIRAAADWRRWAARLRE
jgi:hypothetical protein